MIIIGIAGGTGSGKTTVVHRICESFSDDEVSVIAQDAYYRDNSHLSEQDRARINYDHPGAIEFDLLEEHLSALRRGETIHRPRYSYVHHTRLDETVGVRPTAILVVEGILIFTHPALRELCDIKIFVHTDADERLIRRIRRDIHERGRELEGVLAQYEDTLKPMHEQFIEPTKRYADLIVPVGGDNVVAIDVITSMIRTKLID